MTTNQTIDGVPRAALEILLSGRGGLAQAAAAHELRALLDSTALQCSVPAIDTSALGSKPAAQPHGEPVARLGVHHVLGAIHNVPGFPGVKGNHIHDLTTLLNGILAGAEQPAPVAVGLPVDPERERLMEIVQQYPNVDPLKYDAAVRTLRK